MENERQPRQLRQPLKLAVYLLIIGFSQPRQPFFISKTFFELCFIYIRKSEKNKQSNLSFIY